MAKKAKSEEVKDGSEVNVVVAPEVKRGRGRPKKVTTPSPAPVPVETPAPVPAPKKRGRPRKVVVEAPVVEKSEPKPLSSQRITEHNEQVEAKVKTELKKKVIGEADKKTLEQHRSGGIKLLECISEKVKGKLTVEIQLSKADKATQFVIREGASFTCTRDQYEILNTKIDGGLTIVGEIISETANKREAHIAEAQAESLRLKKLFLRKRKDGTIQDENNKNEDAAESLFSGSENEEVALKGMDDIKTLKRALAIAQEHGNSNLERKIRKRLAEVSNTVEA